MKRLPTKVAEEVYSLLQRKIGASSETLEKEAFIYHYGVVLDTPSHHRILCKDGITRKFICTQNQNMWVEGEGVDEANQILRAISKKLKSEVN